MSVVLFDLGQRLRAATLARPVARSTYAPVLPPVEPVAITLTRAGDGALVRATDATSVTTATGQGALSALDELGVSGAPQAAKADALDNAADAAGFEDMTHEPGASGSLLSSRTNRNHLDMPDSCEQPASRANTRRCPADSRPRVACA